jgi:hypothetical protein
LWKRVWFGPWALLFLRLENNAKQEQQQLQIQGFFRFAQNDENKVTTTTKTTTTANRSPSGMTSKKGNCNSDSRKATARTTAATIAFP